MISKYLLRLTLTLTVLMCSWAQAAAPANMVQVEVLLFRQGDTPLIASQPPAANWAEGSSLLTERNEVPLSMTEQASKLTPDQGYQILLHKAWRQTMSSPTVDLSIKEGQGQFEFFPIQGRVRLSFGDQVSMNTDLWLNTLDEQGRITACEHLEQQFRVRTNEIRYLDHGSLGVLIRVNRL